MKKLLLILLLSVIAYGKSTVPPVNSSIVRSDTIIVSRDSVRYTPILYKMNRGMHKAVKITMNDTTNAGFASDTGAIRVEVYQAFNNFKDPSKVDIFPSRAHPDSSHPGGTDFRLYDSLDIADMDTSAEWVLSVGGARVSASGDTLQLWYSESLDSVITAPLGAKSYMFLVPDYSPGLLLKVTGLIGKEIPVIIDWYIRDGTPVFDD
jgi:hypothetical protein